MSAKTEYRIMPVEDRHGFIWYYLQFKYTHSGTEKVRNWFGFTTGERQWTKSDWRFIPEHDHGVYSGWYLEQGDCPTHLAGDRDFNFMRSYYWNQNGNEFWARCKPDIETYFAERRARHESYVKEKERERRDAAPRYLV